MFYLSNFIICKWDCFISSFQIPKSFPLYWTCLDSQEKLSCGSKCPTLSQTHGKMCSISSLSMMFALSMMMFFIMMKKFLLFLLLWVFIKNECWVLSAAFSASVDIVMWFFFFSLLMWWITLNDFSNIETAFYLWITWHLVMVYNSFYIQLDSIC